MSNNELSISNEEWAAAVMKPLIAANERECEGVRVEIQRRGTDWAAEEIVDLRSKLTLARKQWFSRRKITA